MNKPRKPSMRELKKWMERKVALLVVTNRDMNIYFAIIDCIEKSMSPGPSTKEEK